jgi:hypothetical protein
MPIYELLLACAPVALVVVVFWRLRSRRGRIGPGDLPDLEHPRK